MIFLPFSIVVIPDEVPRSLEIVVRLITVQVTVAVPYAPLLIRSSVKDVPNPMSGSCVITLDCENDMYPLAAVSGMDIYASKRGPIRGELVGVTSGITA